MTHTSSHTGHIFLTLYKARLHTSAMGVCNDVGCGMQLSRVQLAWAVFDAGSFGFYSITYNTCVRAPLLAACHAVPSRSAAHLC